MATEAWFDPIGKARARARLLELIPAPTGRVYDEAARAALIRAGVSEENIAILEDADQKPPAVFHP